MVSRRIAAALGADLLLAQRWVSALARSAVDGLSRSGLRIRPRRGAAICRGVVGEAGGRSRGGGRGLRGPARLSAQGAPASGQRRSAEQQAGDSRGTRAAAPGISSAVLASPMGTCCRCSAAGARAARSGRPSLWMLRARHLFLIPGDSPVGFRLPLESLALGAGLSRGSRCGRWIRWHPLLRCRLRPSHLTPGSGAYGVAARSSAGGRPFRPTPTPRLGRWCARRWPWKRGRGVSICSCRR